MTASEWTPHFALATVETPDGPVNNQPVMRRKKPEGGYEYRRMTEAEMNEWQSSEAW
jgi:hypothetical protein